MRSYAMLAFVRDAPLERGTMVGEYRVDRVLGSGTFGAVYAGEQPLIGKRVAIKVLHRELSSEPEVVSRFVEEARAVNRIRHRNIIDIFSFGQLGEQLYFVMELLDGLTLEELLEKEGRLGVARALPILRGIADGLDAAHEAGVTHRDLKPENVFLASQKDGSYFPKLLDFGVAKLVTEDRAHKTATGVAIGTPRYMAPEQARGRAVDHRADIYALGVLAHEVLTGRPPFEGSSVTDVLIKHATEPPPSMSSVCAELPHQLDAPVLAMLAKRPGARPASAGAAVTALAEVARSLGIDREGAAAAADGAARGAPARPGGLQGTTMTVGKPGPAGATPEGAAPGALAAAPVEADGQAEDVASARTVEVQRSPPAATVKAAPLLVEAAQASVEETVASGPPAVSTASSEMARPRAPLEAPPHAGRSWALIALAAAGVALGGIALLRGGAGPAPAPSPSPPIASTPDTPAAPASAAQPSAPTGEVSAPVVTPAAPDAGAPDAAPPATKQPRKTIHKEIDIPPELQGSGSRGTR